MFTHSIMFSATTYVAAHESGVASRSSHSKDNNNLSTFKPGFHSFEFEEIEKKKSQSEFRSDVCQSTTYFSKRKKEITNKLTLSTHQLYVSQPAIFSITVYPVFALNPILSGTLLRLNHYRPCTHAIG
jgi:hypothetical protein